jgi:hypothetical protein
VQELYWRAETFGGDAAGLPPYIGQQCGATLRDGALTQHLVSAIMQAEDAPQQRNRVDLDPTAKDVFGYPVARDT